VVPNGPAEKAGLRAGTAARRFQARAVRVGGDIITAVDGRKLPDEAALGVALLRLRPGQNVTLRVYRDGRPRDVRVTLGERPLESTSAVRP
ncbi:MAG: hypothetical protein QOJ85_3737, partial [Solirubrobacteraceae bacterium]|nr:hypothetical protein [Solirubrobacteraceae bacterium]